MGGVLSQITNKNQHAFFVGRSIEKRFLLGQKVVRAIKKGGVA